MRRPETFLGGLSPGEFLSQHWQKQPLLVRGALPGYTPPLSPDELAGLALSEQVESRLVQERSGTFELERGPFDEATFAGLPESHYTLLVQDLDQHVPEVGELFELLDFLPSYRLDDVMASFAAPSGSVGPHFDQYDVFLLQVRGRRRWQIARAYDPAKLRDDTELCVLSEFQSEQEWVLDPGDMLYLPPRVAHYGVAVDACMTFSLGCRAPSVAEIVAHFAQAVVEQASEGERYEDPDLLPPGDRDCLDPAAVARVGRLLAERLSFDERALAQNLASLLTRPKALFAPEEHERLGTRSAARAVTSATGFVRRTGSRWLVCPLGDSLHLFVDGEGLAVPEGAEQMARELCRERVLSAQRVRDLRAQAACVSLLVELVARGALEPDGAG